jgi:hypothetical protein
LAHLVPGTSGVGTSGSSGTSGTGVTGTSGTSGANGSSGTSGNSGSSGTSGDGTAGTSGSSGTAGAPGTSGTSGTLSQIETLEACITNPYSGSYSLSSGEFYSLPSTITSGSIVLVPAFYNSGEMLFLNEGAFSSTNFANVPGATTATVIGTFPSASYAINKTPSIVYPVSYANSPQQPVNYVGGFSALISFPQGISTSTYRLWLIGASNNSTDLYALDYIDTGLSNINTTTGGTVIRTNSTLKSTVNTYPLSTNTIDAIGIALQVVSGNSGNISSSLPLKIRAKFTIS